MSYVNEAAFSKALLAKLQLPIKQRIESGLTGRGIPDLYLGNIWIELKNQPFDIVKRTGIWYIRWRKGQQAWAARYYRHMKRPVYTAVAVSDGFMWIPMHKLYDGNLVTADDVIRMTHLQDLVFTIQEMEAMYAIKETKYN